MFRKSTFCAALAGTALAASTAVMLPAAASAQLVDPLGRPSPEVLAQLKNIAELPFIPENISSTINTLVGFFEGTGESDVPLPPANGPRIAQFLYPTVAEKCIDGKQSSVGTALALPGPSEMVAPRGTKSDESTFVFTALGTGPVAKTQRSTMQVDWVNISTGASGSTGLNYTGINPEGPATLSGVAPTGHGQVLAVLSGGVTTEYDSGPADCNYLPTVVSYQTN